MNAVISGRAGVALLLQGDRLFSLDLDKPEELIPRRPDEYHLLIGEGTDLEFLEEVDPAAVRQRLENAVCREEALDVSLLLLDGGLADAIRNQAAADLEECFEAPRALDSLEAVLYAAPLPETADLPGALRCAQNQEQSVRPFLRRLEAQQPAIRMVRQTWEALPERFFGGADERRDAMTICLRAGLFRDLARALAESGSPGSHVIQVLDRRPELDRFRKALTHWGKLLSVQGHDACPAESSLRTKLQMDDVSLMVHFTCDLCGKDLTVSGEGRYVVKIEGYLGFDPTEIKEDDLDDDPMEVVAQILQRDEALVAEDLATPLQEGFRFDLCPSCHMKFVQDGSRFYLPRRLVPRFQNKIRAHHPH